MLSATFGRPWELEKLVVAVMADELFDPNLTLVAREKGMTLGYLHSVIQGDRAWIKLLAIHPSRRKQGLGREMVERLEERVLGEGAKTVAAGFSTPPLHFAGVSAGSRGFFEKLGYQAGPGGSFGRIRRPARQGGGGDPKSAALLIKEANPGWWSWAEEQLSYPDPRIRASGDGKAVCFWEAGRIGPVFGEEASAKQAVEAAAGAAGGEELEFMDSRGESWWRERFDVVECAACLEMKKEL